jgi:hypothetical protein
MNGQCFCIMGATSRGSKARSGRPGGDEPEYRIKSANEPHERVARESELIKA